MGENTKKLDIENALQTRKYPCVNARGIPPAAQQVLAVLLCLLGGIYPCRVLTLAGGGEEEGTYPGGGIYPGQDVPILVGGT